MFMQHLLLCLLSGVSLGGRQMSGAPKKLNHKYNVSILDIHDPITRPFDSLWGISIIALTPHT